MSLVPVGSTAVSGTLTVRRPAAVTSSPAPYIPGRSSPRPVSTSRRAGSVPGFSAGGPGGGLDLQPPRQQVLLLSTHQIGRVQSEQWLSLRNALADVIRIEVLHPATDPSVDVHEVGLGILQYSDCPHGRPYRTLGGPSKRDAEPRGFGTIQRDPPPPPPPPDNPSRPHPGLAPLPPLSGAGALLPPHSRTGAHADPPHSP